MKAGHDVSSLEEFQHEYSAEFAEWQSINDELQKDFGPMAIITAAQVSGEQRRRMSRRGEVSVLDGLFARCMMSGVSPLRIDV